MATATKAKPRAKANPKQDAAATVQAAVAETATNSQVATSVKVETLYLITGEGLEILIGTEGDWVRELVKRDTESVPLAYKRYNDDKRVWETWAVLQPDGNSVKPIGFPNPSEYGMTPPELYIKTETYKSILAHAMGLLRKEKESVWDKMTRPTAVIIGIVVIVLVVGFVMVAMQG